MAVKVAQQCGLMLCFHFSKAFFYLIRPRKLLVTCWWEPMEKNTHTINGAVLIPRAVSSGCGNSMLSESAVARR